MCSVDVNATPEIYANKNRSAGSWGVDVRGCVNPYTTHIVATPYIYPADFMGVGTTFSTMRDFIGCDNVCSVRINATLHFAP